MVGTKALASIISAVCVPYTTNKGFLLFLKNIELKLKNNCEVLIFTDICDSSIGQVANLIQP